MINQITAILTIAQRDFTKLLRDRARILATFIFPFLFIGILGTSLESNLPPNIGYSFKVFVFTGVLAQTLFQSTASGIISLIEDRENDFSQEIFVSPISRYSIIIGKILGETAVSMAQGLGIIAFGLLIGIPLSLEKLTFMFPAGLMACLFGGAFGILVLSNLKSQRSANQIFPFIIFPQFFLAGVFNPIKTLPPFLHILSRVMPMTYAVDLMRGVYYANSPEKNLIVLHSISWNVLVISVFFIIFLLLGTALFIKNEKNK